MEEWDIIGFLIAGPQLLDPEWIWGKCLTLQTTERERERERAKYNVKEGLMTALFTDPAYCIIINDEVTNAT